MNVGSPEEHISIVGGWEVLFPLSGKIALSECLFSASFSSMLFSTGMFLVL